MKRKLTFLSRLSGIMLGVSLTFVMAVFAMTSVITNGDFWLKQNDRYKHQETLSLVSSDDYSVLYKNYISQQLESALRRLIAAPQGISKSFTM